MARFALWLLPTFALAATPPSTPSARQLVLMVQELSDDYGEAMESTDPSAKPEVVALSDQTLQLAKSFAAGKKYAARIEAVAALVRSNGKPYKVKEASDALIHDLVINEKIAVAPKSLPSLEHGKALYTQGCAACHGADGRANTAAAEGLKPRPANLQSGDPMDELSPFRVYNALTYGIPNTAMPAFVSWTEEERWAVSFYVFSLRAKECKSPPLELGVEKLSSTSDDDLRADYGTDGLSCLRRLQFAKAAARK